MFYAIKIEKIGLYEQEDGWGQIFSDYGNVKKYVKEKDRYYREINISIYIDKLY